ncbi:phosphate ABC transporter substrate-binding protein PstS [Microbacterium terricola]|uniref:PBP domain-containing protein n=1 Tax=Microbacterium terricola TaxID=344163 RepID=A0ABM8E382_9MICO|nr:phosphate ABC transporter substrate-binding protein PstS [Microbacterium terricola]UYK40074.1 phosphate ABC transporter substrate-binding protein PstS [Microbacterium terricola]BDV32229.1 hypothetical protein Microterr_28890 [Microbacterium terricola]
MIRRPSRFRRLALVLAGLLVMAAGLTSVPATADDSWTRISGSGSTWSQNALDQWRRNVASNYAMTVNYSGVGSSAGRTDFINRRVDFAISEIPFQTNPTDNSAPERPTTKYAYMPIVAGGTSFMYNLKIGGKRVTNLRLSGTTITKIFTGAIKKWNDAAIQADNPGLKMPDRTIVPVVRSDGSGSSAQFTLWMSKTHSDIWKAGMTSQFPTPSGGKAQNGSLGVAGYVSQNYGEGAITYVEYSYALKSGFPVAKVLNEAGYYIEPTASSVAVAMLKAKINDNESSVDYLTQILDGVYGSTDPRAYPLSSYSYMIVPTETTNVFTKKKGRTLGAFASYVLCEGQQQAAALGYSPLPMNLVMAGSDQIKRIPGAGSAGIDLAKCNNPTFKAGDSPSSNQLAKTAPQPADCDRKGPNQCTTGTAGAGSVETPTTGSGTGGSSAGAGSGGSGSGGSGSGDGSGAAAGGSGGDGGSGDASGDAGGGSGEAVYDSNGALVSGSTGTAVAASAPFTLESDEWGAPQTLMLAAGILLVLAMVVPPLASRRLRRGGSQQS